LQTIEEKVVAGGLSVPRAPEPILTCVQCQEGYKESQNAEGYCKYHPSPLQSAGWDYMYVVTILYVKCMCLKILDTVLNAVIRSQKSMTQQN